MRKISDTIKLLRLEKRMTQQQLADKLNIKRSALSMYESDQRTPPDDVKDAICDYFNVDMNYLYGKTNIRNSFRENEYESFQNSLSMDFKELVSTRRLQLGLTMEELGNKVGVSKATVQRWESGEITNVRRDKIANLAKALNVTPAYLMGWEETNNDLTISDRLNKYTSDKEIKTLSAGTGLSERKLKQWLSGEKEPNMGQVRKLANYLNVKVSDIIGEGYTEPKGVSIPVLGKVIAGIPIEAIEDIIDYEEINAEMAKSGEYFALQISGDSMEPKFSAGDVVIVRKQPTIESGQIAIVRVNGYDATVKKVLINDGGITLVPFNTTAYEPIFYSKKQIQELPVEIAGRVVELRAKF